ncbi:hypothetical protein DSM112329_02429 [Paraconexibacter sp. AEG42_29]|uniref:Uncharacterized protein n=1 Tax=Paraconexibacter sp. AEG42_29 TaxID=2997339 RepID=A0AAU7AVC2_9ACTN
MSPRPAIAMILVATLAAPLLVALSGPPAARLAAMLVLIGLAPGAALIGPGSALTPARGGLLAGLSLAISLLIAQGMVSFGGFSPRVATYALAAVCAPLLVVRLRRGTGLAS